MTRVVFFRSEDGPVGFEADGHTGFAQSGEDIVCAAVSAVLLTAVNGLEEIVVARPRVVRRDAKGYLKAMLPTDLDGPILERAILVMRVAQAGLEEIEKTHPGFVRVTSRKWRERS